MRHALVLCASLAVVSLPSVAFADEADELALSMDHDALALSADDCGSACKALASMRRAADRICALDPGKRCEAARAKLESATNKVRGACPACVVGSKESVMPKPAPAPARAAEADATPTAQSVPSESKRGGCAGCATTSGPSAEPWLAALGLALLFRRRRQEPRDSRTSSTATLPPRT